MNIKRDIKLWRKFFAMTNRPSCRILLANTEISLQAEETNIKNATDLRIWIDGEDMVINATDAHRLGTALLGYSKAWWQRNQDVQRGYSTRRWEETEKALGMDKRK